MTKVYPVMLILQSFQVVEVVLCHTGKKLVIVCVRLGSPPHLIFLNW